MPLSDCCQKGNARRIILPVFAPSIRSREKAISPRLFFPVYLELALSELELSGRLLMCVAVAALSQVARNLPAVNELHRPQLHASQARHQLKDMPV